MKNSLLFLESLMLAVLITPGLASCQVVEGFDAVFGFFPDDTGQPLEGWEGAIRSEAFGPTGIFPGLDSVGGFFDAQDGGSMSYVGMNFNNAETGANDVTSTWLMSPEVEMKDGDSVSFWTRTIEASMFPDRLIVRLSTSGDSVDVGEGALGIGDFQTVLADINPINQLGGYPEEWTRFEIELSGLGGKTSGRIAFHYFNQFMDVNGNYIGIDSFSFIPFLLGDVNCDGVVNLLDITPFVEILTSAGFSEKADLNGDGEVTLEDIDPFIDALIAA